MLVVEGHKHMAEVGFAHFSARAVAKRIGYTIGTLYNVFGSYDHLILAINTRTFVLWADYVRAKLAACAGDRIACLVQAYFDFARANRNAWLAIYDHRLPADLPMPEEHDILRSGLMELVVAEIAAVLPPERCAEAPRLARSLIAVVHGHCTFDINGSFALMGVDDAGDMALSRVREILLHAGAVLPEHDRMAL